MYYIKRLFYQLISRSKFVTLILHNLWIVYQKIRCGFKYYYYFKLRRQISSLSDRGQDKWIIEIFELKKKNYKGFFLEIGGGDGFCNSNTFLIEKYYGWKGILVEPNPDLFKKLLLNRPNMILSNKIIYDKSNFFYFKIEGELSRIVKENEIKNKNDYIELKSIKLVELLQMHKAPSIIDFFSLDVEGSEDKVLTQELLDNYTFLSLCVERPSNYLHELLIKKKYIFVRSNVYDCFYVNEKFFNLKKIKLEKYSQYFSK